MRANGFAHTRLPRFGLDSPFGNLLSHLASYTQPQGVRSYLRSHLGRVPRYDTRKITRDLAIEFRNVDDSIVETCRDLQRWGHVATA